MENAFARAEELANTLKEYADNEIASVKLNVAEKSAAVLANLIAGCIAAAVFLLFFIFSGVALAIFFVGITGKIWSGFLLVAFLFLLTGIIIWAARIKLIRLPVMNFFLTQLIKYDEQD
jgi:uncharacterized RDD family membrane protein YckC